MTDPTAPRARRPLPRTIDDLTPEQQAALVEFGNRFVEGMGKLAEALRRCTAAALGEPVLPTAIGSTVLVRGMGGNKIALQLRPDPSGRVAWLHPHGNPWVAGIVRDHLIEVLHDAGEIEPSPNGDTTP
jgi:hypothetical protein